MKMTKAVDFKPEYFDWRVDGKVATITLNRPERKNPLTFDSYDELGKTFRALAHVDDVKAVVITGAGGNFCSGGDVHDIIKPLTEMDMPELLDFTRMTGELVKAMRACPQPIVAAIEGSCAGAGAARPYGWSRWPRAAPPHRLPARQTARRGGGRKKARRLTSRGVRCSRSAEL